MQEWVSRFETWWNETPVSNYNLSHRRIAGTIADVYTSVQDGDKCVAVKTVCRDSTNIMHDNIMLFSEYTIHSMVLDLYDKENRKPRLVRLHWLKKINIRGNTVVAFAMDRLHETWYNRTRSGYLPIHWKGEALAELSHWNTVWGFFHRDPHLNNIGVLNDEWIFFDLSMSCFSTGLTVYNKEAFYEETECLNFHLDPAILNASWCRYQNDSSWKMIQCAWKSSTPSQWKPRTPIIIKNCILAKNGRFLSYQGNMLSVEIKIPKRFVTKYTRDICFIRGMPSSLIVQSVSDNNVTCVTYVHKTDVKVDIDNQHIAYYLYEI